MISFLKTYVNTPEKLLIKLLVIIIVKLTLLLLEM